MKDPAPLTILHLSDPQFGRNHRFGNLSPGDPDAKFDTLLQRLTDDLDFLKKDQDVKPQIVVVSGDLAEWAKKKEFDDAREFLGKLSEHLKISRRHAVIVPGNHDINRDLAAAYHSQCSARDETPLETCPAKWEFYAAMFEQFYKGEGVSFTLEEPWTLWRFDELKLVVAALNSTMKESHKEDSHYGWVGEGQLRWFAEKLAPYKEQGWFRLGVVHHNVLRGAKDDDENLRDAEELENRLGFSLNLLLHGHTHNSKIGWLGPLLPVLSTGSAALKKEARPDEVPNQYQAIRLRQGRMERWTRRYDPEQKRWIADPRCSKDGNGWYIEEKVDFESVSGIFPVESRKSSTTTFPRLLADLHRSVKEASQRDDFAGRVAEIARLRYRDAEIEVRRSDGTGLNYLRIKGAEGPTTRVWPIGVSEHGISYEQLERFRNEVVATYRALDPGMQSEVVYGGERAADILIHHASATGIRLVSFVEFQGIIDFRGYVQRQMGKLEASEIYPPKLYVSQRTIYEIGRDRHDAPDACAAVLDWLKDPLGRFVLVLGDFGAGKTFLLHEIARRMSSEIPHLVPVLIELRSLEKARSLEELIAQHLTAAGERYLDLAAFPYMLREGRIALLFDGFDELVLRVTYQRATEHMDTLLQAAAGRAKVVVSSRTQHFESDDQVKTALFQRAETVPGLRVARVQPFNEQQIRQFLENLLDGDKAQAEARFDLIKHIQDLLGLSQNPRMLSFIAALPEEKLREAQEKKGKITSAELYRLLIERWLTYEFERAQPKGAQPTLTVAERWQAVTAVALCLWLKIERTMRVSELTEEVGKAVEKLTEKQEKKLDEHTAAHLVGSGTLLVRDETGAFSFVHQSVMEWLVANRAGEQIAAKAIPTVLVLREMSPLMADFFAQLAGRERAVTWAQEAMSAHGLDQPFAKSNAALLMERLGEKAAVQVQMARADLRGKSFSGQNLQGADFGGADLVEARFEGAELDSANLSHAVIEGADFKHANLRKASLEKVKARAASFLGADLREAELAGADLRLAKLVGAQLLPGALERCRTWGWAPSAPQAIAPMTSSSSLVTSIATNVHNVVASGHADGHIRLWDTITGKELRVLAGHTGPVQSVAFNMGGSLLASGGADTTVRLWDAASGTELRVLEGHKDVVRSLAFNIDGSLLASGSEDKTIRLWDAVSGKKPLLLEGQLGPVWSVAFSPDGARLASGSDDKAIRLWDVASGKKRAALEGHRRSVQGVAFSRDGTRLASGGADRTVRLWDATSGEQLWVLEGHEDWVRSVAFSTDGAQLASGSDDKTVRLWDAVSGKELRVLEGHQHWVMSLVFSMDGARLASGSYDNTVRLWDAASGKEQRVLEGRQNRICSVAFSRNGLQLASGGSDQTVRLWDAGNGKQLHVLRGHQDCVNIVAFRNDGARLASGSDDGSVRLWDAASGEQLWMSSNHKSSVESVVFSPDGTRVATGGHDKKVRMWDAVSGKELRVLEGHKDVVRSVAFSPDGTRVASSGHDKVVRLWDAVSEKELWVLEGHKDVVRSVAFSPDGTQLASGGCDNTVWLWDTVRGMNTWVLRGHKNWILSVVFSPDGTRLASGSYDNTVRLWDVARRQEHFVLRGHQNGIRSVSFNQNGTLLATASDDNTIRVWDVASGKLLATIVPAAEGWATFTPDGRYKVSGNIEGRFWYAINLCRFEPGELDPFLPPGTLRQVALDEPLW